MTVFDQLVFILLNLTVKNILRKYMLQTTRK